MFSYAALREIARAADTLHVPIAASEKPLNVDVLEWALAAKLLPHAETMLADKPAAEKLNTKLQAMHADVLKLPPEASSLRLRLLRVAGSVYDMSDDERAYAALHEPQRTALLGLLAGCFQGAAVPLAVVDSTTGRYVPLRTLAEVLPFAAGLLADGASSCEEAVVASRSLGEELARVAAGAGATDEAIALRLRELQLMDTPGDATKAERKYAQRFEPARRFRQAIRDAIAALQPANTSRVQTVVGELQQHHRHSQQDVLETLVRAGLLAGNNMACVVLVALGGVSCVLRLMEATSGCAASPALSSCVSHTLDHLGIQMERLTHHSTEWHRSCGHSTQAPWCCEPGARACCLRPSG